jgi:myosin heavy subunit
VRIRREAYPVRVPFSEFYDRFELLYTREARKAAKAAAAANGTGVVTSKSVTVLPSPADASIEQAQSASKAILARHIGAESAYYQVHTYSTAAHSRYLCSSKSVIELCQYLMLTVAVL